MDNEEWLKYVIDFLLKTPNRSVSQICKGTGLDIYHVKKIIKKLEPFLDEKYNLNERGNQWNHVYGFDDEEVNKYVAIVQILLELKPSLRMTSKDYLKKLNI